MQCSNTYNLQLVVPLFCTTHCATKVRTSLHCKMYQNTDNISKYLGAQTIWNTLSNKNQITILINWLKNILAPIQSMTRCSSPDQICCTPVHLVEPSQLLSKYKACGNTIWIFSQFFEINPEFQFQILKKLSKTYSFCIFWRLFKSRLITYQLVLL